MQSRKATVVLSGGQDSTICLAWAKANFAELHAITFNYGQRHAIEIEAAKKIASMASVPHEVVDLGSILVGTSPLIDKAALVGHYESAEKLPGGIEPTFVPFRNLLLLTIAANRAVAAGSADLITGICQTDFGGYPDCRETFRNSAQETLSWALTGAATGFQIHAPLMHLTKSESVALAKGLPGAMEMLAYSHTCYDGEYPPNPHNHASILRAKGFAEANTPDPLIVRAKAEGLLPDDYPDTGLVAGTPFALGTEAPVDEHKPSKKSKKKDAPAPGLTSISDEDDRRDA